MTASKTMATLRKGTLSSGRFLRGGEGVGLSGRLVLLGFHGKVDDDKIQT